MYIPGVKLLLHKNLRQMKNNERNIQDKLSYEMKYGIIQ